MGGRLPPESVAGLDRNTHFNGKNAPAWCRGQDYSLDLASFDKFDYQKFTPSVEAHACLEIISKGRGKTVIAVP